MVWAQTFAQNKVKDQQLAQRGGVTVQSTIHTKQYKKQGEKSSVAYKQQGQGV